MDPKEIMASLGQRFEIAHPEGNCIRKVIGREPEGRHPGEPGWQTVYGVRNKDGKPVEKTEIVTSIEIIALHEPYIPGEEDDEWEYEEPQGCTLQSQTIPNASLTPTIDTPGFDLVSPLAMKVWVALFDHAQNCALSMADATTDYAEERSPQIDHSRKNAAGNDENGRGIPGTRRAGMEGRWVVASLAKAVGKKDRAIHYALDELARLAWIRMEKLRADSGQIAGFRYWILPPPKALNELARTTMLAKAKEKLHDAVEDVRRIKNAKRGTNYE